jgi:hypothetical protein
MRFGVTLPNLGVGDDPRVVVDLAEHAEQADSSLGRRGFAS